MQSPSKFQTQLFKDLVRKILNYKWKNKNPRLVKTLLYNKRTAGGLIIPDIKINYRALVIK